MASGVAGGSFNAKIIPIRVNSRSTYIEWQAVKRALEYIENLLNKPDVINTSFGAWKLLSAVMPT